LFDSVQAQLRLEMQALSLGTILRRQFSAMTSTIHAHSVTSQKSVETSYVNGKYLFIHFNYDIQNIWL
jgi:hypothetical protein